MRFEVYCDESRPELFSDVGNHGGFLMIGSLWLPADLRGELKRDIHALRERWNTWGEIKWSKVSAPRLDFYASLIDRFFGFGDELRFRCIAVDTSQVNMTLHDNDAELGFYKFYYQLLHHWIYDFNEYRIFCDTKTSRDPDRLAVLRRCLGYANLSSAIVDVQALPSREVVPMQLADLLLGMAGARLNHSVTPSGTKDRLIQHLENRLGVPELAPTSKSETKFNIFRIHLTGGW